MMRCVASIGYGANEEMLEVTISLIDTGLWRLEKTRRIERGLFALASPLSQTQIMGNLSFVILSIIFADKQSKAHLDQNTKTPQINSRRRHFSPFDVRWRKVKVEVKIKPKQHPVDHL